MKILVFGVGVLGSVYAAKLRQAGHTVAVLARGQRAIDLQTHGIVLENAATGTRETTPVTLLEHLEPDDPYDVILVVVRKDQLAGVLPIIAGHRATPSILFMVNTALGPDELVEAVGRERVLLGFAGAGGTRTGYVVQYHVLPGWQQPTTLGELNGQRTARVLRIGTALHEAGFPVAFSRNMDAWLKTHVMWTCPVAHSLYMVGGSNFSVAHTRDALVLWIRAVREGFQVLRALGVPITPPSLRVFELLPEPLLVAALSRLLDTPTAELVIAQHANAARAEYVQLGNEVWGLAHRAGVAMPAFERLRPFVDSTVPLMRAGSATLPLHWREVGPWACALGVLAILASSRIRQRGSR
jgi:2-dehydropantoate 2-reductase